MKSAKHIIVCINQRANPDQPSCGMSAGVEIAAALPQAIAAHGLHCEVKTFYCLGKCELGPNAKLAPSGDFCHQIDPHDLGPVLAKIAAFTAD